MKKIAIKLAKIVVVIIILGLMWGSTSARNATIKFSYFNGYERPVLSGDGANGHYCGTEFSVWVANSSDLLTTGTYVYLDASCTTAFPNGIIVSQSGSTFGQTFYVANGVITSTAIPC